jgi:hypothetical protein
LSVVAEATVGSLALAYEQVAVADDPVSVPSVHPINVPGTRLALTVVPATTGEMLNENAEIFVGSVLRSVYVGAPTV